MNRRLFAVAVAMTVAAACSTSSSGSAAPTGSAAPGPITIQLTEFQILMPPEIPGGVQTLHIENIGGMPHFVEFMAISANKTNDDIQAYLDDPSNQQGPPPKWLQPATLPSFDLHSSGASSDVTVDLPAGRYAAFCWMPDAQGTPHAMDGMHTVFDVTGSGDGASMPTPEITATWDGTGITGVPDALPAGVHTFGLVNDGPKAADFGFAQKLKEGSVSQLSKDVNAWFKSLYAGSPPVRFLGGVGLPEPGDGVQAVISLDLPDGEFALAGPGKSTPVEFTVGAGGIPSPAPSISETTCAPAGSELTVQVSGLAFGTGCLAAPAETPFTIAFDNQDANVPHNLSILPVAEGAKAVFTGEIVTGVASATYQVDALKAGTYRFQCDIHPTTMNGTFVVG